MEELYFNAFILAVIYQDEFVFYDCLTDIYGRKYIKLDDDKNVQEEQLSLAGERCLVSIKALSSESHMELTYISKIDDFSDIKDRALVDTCIQTMRLVLKRNYEQLYLAYLTHVMHLLRKKDIPSEYALIRYLFHILKPLKTNSCAICGHSSWSDATYYFNPITYQFECNFCQRGESFGIRLRTLGEINRLITCKIEELPFLKIVSSKYIIFLLTEAMAYRYEASEYLEKYKNLYENS